MELWKSLFKNPWTPLVGGLLMGFVNTMMFAFDSPWAVFTGMRNWGLHMLELIPGVGDVAQASPLEYKSSVMNIAFFIGALSAAALAKQFGIRIPPLREAIKGFFGGVLMGIGANLAKGCTIGGFYSSIASLSASGLYMMLGLLIGTIAGLKLLIVEKKVFKAPARGGRMIAIPVAIQIPLGVAGLLAGFLAIPYYFYFDYLDFPELGIIFALAMVIGIANQRSRFCFVRAFREPFMTGDGEMTKAAVATFVVVILGFALVKYAEIRDLLVNVAPSSGWPAILGGIIFGLGMSYAGGCASGSIWRAGEGHIKLWLAVLGFSLSAAVAHIVLADFRYVNRIFLPESYDSWIIGILIPIGIMYVWYWLASWNEKSEKLVMNV